MHLHGTHAALPGYDVPLGYAKWLWAVLVTVVFLAGCWAWTSGLSGPFQFDDLITPLDDPASQSLAAWQEHLPVTLRPITKLSYALEAEAGIAFEPAPRRLVSLLLHAATACLLFLLISQFAPATMPWLPALLAALWFVHPVHADSILMLSGRSATMSTALLLAALLALERSRSWWAALLFLLACLSRETALAGLLPLVVLAASRPATTPRALVREVLPLLAASAIVLLWILSTPRYLDLAEYSLLGRPFWSSFSSQVGAVPVGLWLLFNPSALSIDYGVPLPKNPQEPLLLLGVTMYLAAALAMIWFLRRSRAAAIGSALWLASLIPTQSVIPKLDALTNRPLSLALAGLLLVMAPLLAAGWSILRLKPAGIDGKRTTPPAALDVPAGTHWVVACAAVAVFALLTGATAQRAELFRSELSLWLDAASKSLTNARPHQQYAVLLKRAGREWEAWVAISTARSIDPFSADIAAMSRTLYVKEVPQ